MVPEDNDKAGRLSWYKLCLSGLITKHSIDMRLRLLVYSLIIIALSGCGKRTKPAARDLIIFHAGSLSVPFGMLREKYQKMHPDVRVLLEPAGSLVCARKITELKKPCDIMASADYFVINELLIPGYAQWGIRFATNEIVIAYTEKSKYSTIINDTNWTDVLLRDDVIYGRADPDNDPCGYRTVFTFMLAARYYAIEGLEGKFLAKNKDYIRPKEVDLVALMESNAIDYMFQYKSVAIQHGLKYIELPDEISLGNPEMNDLYSTVRLEVNGSKPGEIITVKGEYINYSLTVLDSAPQKETALDFVSFAFSEEGMEVFRASGQEPLSPVSTDQPQKIPQLLVKFLGR